MKKKNLPLVLIILFTALFVIACARDAPPTHLETAKASLTAKASPTTSVVPEPLTESPPAPTASPTPTATPPMEEVELNEMKPENPFTLTFEERRWPRSQAYVEAREVLVTKSGQVTLLLRGNLPTPCHQLRVLISKADAEKKIFIDVFSVVDPESVCVQVLAPFEEEVPLGAFAVEEYTFWVDGERVAPREGK